MIMSLFLILLSCSQPVFAQQQWTREFSVGSNSLNASSILDINSTTKGSRPCPVMTEAQRDAISSPANGLCIYNSDTDLLNFYNGTLWGDIGGGGGGGDLWSDPVDANIIPDGAGRSLGSSGTGFDKIDLRAAGASNSDVLQIKDSSGGTQLVITSGSTAMPSGIAGNIAFDALKVFDNLGFTTRNSTTATGTGKILIESGNNSSTGPTGDIHLRPGVPSGGIRGKIKFLDGSEGSSGECWVSSSTGGEGNWQACPGGGTGALTVTGSLGTPVTIDPTVGIAPAGVTREMIFIESTSGTQAVTANPQIAAGGTIGEELILIGTSASEILTLADGTGLALNGLVSLSLQNTIYLVWDGAKWQEISRR